MTESLVDIVGLYASPPSKSWWRMLLCRSQLAPGVGIPELCIKTGRCYAVIGKSGAGKTVLNSLLMGYPSFSVGRGAKLTRAVWWENVRLPFHAVASRFPIVTRLLFARTLRKIRSGGTLLYLPQNLPDGPEYEMSTCEYLRQIMKAMYCECRESATWHLTSKSFVAVLREKLPLNLQDKLSTSVNRLSGGERKRIELWARIQVLNSRRNKKRPALLVLDEPTTGLDIPEERNFLSDLTSGLERDANAAVIVTTHALHLLGESRDGGAGYFDSVILAHKECMQGAESERPVCYITNAIPVNDLERKIRFEMKGCAENAGESIWEWFLTVQGEMKFEHVLSRFFQG